jgi:hypothetical protein
MWSARHELQCILATSYRLRCDGAYDAHPISLVPAMRCCAVLASGGSKKKTYDLNTQSDSFLSRYASSPFPEAVDRNEKELAEVSQQEASIRKGGDALSTALDLLPDILTKKAQLEAHTTIMQAVMQHIAQRAIPSYFEAEQAMLQAAASKGAIDRLSVLALLKDSSKGGKGDKTRLLMLVAILGEVSKVGMEEYDVAFQSGCSSIVGAPAAAAAAAAAAASASPGAAAVTPEAIQQALEGIRVLRRLISLQSPTSMMLRYGTSGGAAGAAPSLSAFLSTAQSRASSLITQATSYFTKFIPYYVSKVVDNLIEGKGQEEEQFVTLDPRSSPVTGTVLSGASGGPVPGAVMKHTDVIVFVVGGGSYSEYFNLQELLRDKLASGGSSLRSIVYGCTDLLSGDDFVQQLEKLAAAGTGTGSAAGASGK